MTIFVFQASNIGKEKADIYGLLFNDRCLTGGQDSFIPLKKGTKNSSPGLIESNWSTVLVSRLPLDNPERNSLFIMVMVTVYKFLPHVPLYSQSTPTHRGIQKESRKSISIFINNLSGHGREIKVITQNCNLYSNSFIQKNISVCIVVVCRV